MTGSVVNPMLLNLQHVAVSIWCWRMLVLPGVASSSAVFLFASGIQSTVLGPVARYVCALTLHVRVEFLYVTVWGNVSCREGFHLFIARCIIIYNNE